MADKKPIVQYNGQLTQILDADPLIVNAGLTRSGTAADVSIYTDASTNTISIGRVGQLLNVKGNLQVDGTVVVVGGTTFEGDVQIGDAGTDKLAIVAGIEGGPLAGPNAAILPVDDAGGSREVVLGSSSKRLANVHTYEIDVRFDSSDNVKTVYLGNSITYSNAVGPGNFQIVPAVSPGVGHETTISGGEGAANNAGGRMTITGGAAGAGAAVQGGQVSVIGGAGSGNGAGGSVSVAGGGGGTSNGGGGAVDVYGGTASGLGTGGSVTITGGPTTGTQSGGTVSIVGGASGGSTIGAAVNITGGAGGPTGNGGDVTIQGGQGGIGGNKNGGNTYLRGGLHSGSGTDGIVYIGDSRTSEIDIGDSANPQTVIFRPYVAYFGPAFGGSYVAVGCRAEYNHIVGVYPSTTTNAAGGKLTVVAGGGNGTGAGGDVEVIAGEGGSADGSGGDAFLRAGNGGATNGNGGSVYIRGGAHAGTGADGTVYIGDQDTAALQIGASGGGTNDCDTTVYGNVTPGTDDAYDLGTSALRWKNVNVGTGNVYVRANSTDYATYSPSRIQYNYPSGGGKFDVLCGAATTALATGNEFEATGGEGGPSDGSAQGGSGGAVRLTAGRGGASSATKDAGIGGYAYVTGGAGGAATLGNGANGGHVYVTGGAGSTGAPNACQGGFVYINGGVGTGGGQGGSVHIDGGSGTTFGGIYIGQSYAALVSVGQTGVSDITIQSKTLTLPEYVAGTSDVTIGSTAQGSTFTGANIKKLHDGSDATGLHYHTSGGSSSVDVAATAKEALVIGQPLVFVNDSGTAKVQLSDADVSGRQDCVGLCSTTASGDGQPTTIRTAGECATTIGSNVYWDTDPTAADVGKRVYISKSQGKLTYDVSLYGTGDFVLRVGWISRVTGGTAYVLVSIGEGVML